MAADVFISHSSKDSPIARTICDFLESRQVQCWMAPRDISPGEEWGDSILRGIQTCRIMVLIFSKSANDSGPVRSEVDRAVNARKVLIPFRIENVAPTGAMEFHIGRRHWLEAYQPPMERHLELLARAVKDALRPPEESAPGTTPPAVEPTLPTSATATGRSEVNLSPPKGQSEGPLRVLLNFNHLVISGYSSTFQIVMENQGESPLEHIEFTMESRGLERGARKTVAKLLPGQSQRHLVEIEPIRSGNFVLQAMIKCRQAARQLALVGSRTIRINEAPKSGDLLSGLAHLQRNSEDGSPSGGGALGNLIPHGSVRTVNDLLDLELPDAFEPLELTLDYDISMRALAEEEAGTRHRLQIPGVFLNESAPATLLKLEPMERNSATSEIRLVATPTFALGRSREESDYLLWFWPRNEVNDQKTRRISKRHCVFTNRDGKLFVSITGANRTILDGREINPNESEPLERRGILAVAGIYYLDVTPFCSEGSDDPQILNLKNWQGPAEEQPSIKPGGSVRFLPMTRSVFEQNSTWLFTVGAFGTSRTNPIIVDVKGLAEIQGRFYHYLGCFWIETTAPNGAVHLDATRLEPGFIAPLVGGQILKLGDKSFKVTVASPVSASA
jgi:hypothetical protein